MVDEPDHDGPALETLAQRYVDLWHDQWMAIANDPEVAEAMVRLFHMMGQSAAFWAPFFNPRVDHTMGSDGSSGESKGDEYGSMSSAGATAAGSSHDGDAGAPSDLDRKLAALEERLAVLERRLAGPGGDADAGPEGR